MYNQRYRLIAYLLVAVILLISGCSNGSKPEPGNGQFSTAFDPENPQEYGLNGIYLGQGIKEAMDVLKPTKYDFMDAVTRESLTIDQLAAGQGSVVMGIILLDRTQLMIKVRQGVVESIILGGVPQEEASKIKTNRGLAMYESAEQVKKLYGGAPEGKELVYKGTKYQALFSVHDNKVIGFRFDPVQ